MLCLLHNLMITWWCSFRWDLCFSVYMTLGDAAMWLLVRGMVAKNLT